MQQIALLGELGGIEAGAQQPDDNERARMRSHGAHDEVQVARRDRFAVHARLVLERLAGVAALVLPMRFLHFPVVDDVVVRVA